MNRAFIDVMMSVRHLRRIFGFLIWVYERLNSQIKSVCFHMISARCITSLHRYHLNIYWFTSLMPSRHESASRELTLFCSVRVLLCMFDVTWCETESCITKSGTLHWLRHTRAWVSGWTVSLRSHLNRRFTPERSGSWRCETLDDSEQMSADHSRGVCRVPCCIGSACLWLCEWINRPILRVSQGSSRLRLQLKISRGDQRRLV